MSARTSSLLLVGLFCSFAWACSTPSEPSATEPAADDAEPTEPPLVEISLSLVDAPTRAGLAARFDPSSALVQAEAVLAVRHRIAAPWHIYWTNPGDSGLRTRVKLTGSDFQAGPVVYPAPDRFVADGGQVSYGWEADAVLFVPLTRLGPDAQIELRSDWLACHESCIPGHASVTASLSDLDPSADPVTAAMLARVPEPARDRIQTRWTGTTLHVEVAPESAAEITIVDWFPHAHAEVTLESAKLDPASLELGYRWTAPPPAELRQGVVALEQARERRFVELGVPWPSP